ncbi:CHAP domain-containing protein, partial [Candidatus Parcubacteria bacterium]|nr:CHAP domain-containing protein [Candidatus Parcubacteria bacterium]
MKGVARLLLVVLVCSSIPIPALAQGQQGVYQLFLPVISKPPQWVRYTNSEYGFSVEVPTGWTQSQEGVFYKQGSGKILITPYVKETSLSVIDFLGRRSQESPGSFDTALGGLPEEPNAVVAGRPAVLLYFPRVATAPANLTVLFVNNNRIFEIECVNPEEGDTRNVYEHVLETFKFGEEFGSIVVAIPSFEELALKGSGLASGEGDCSDESHICCGFQTSESNDFPCCGCCFTYSAVEGEVCNDGNCTWWARHMRPDLERCNRAPAFWKDDSTRAGYIVDPTPEVGSVAIVSGGGHVAYVTNVFSSGFLVSEMNCGRQRCERYGVYYANNPGYRFIHPRTPVAPELPPHPTNVSPHGGPEGAPFFEIGDSVSITWDGFSPSHEEYRVKIEGFRYLGIDGDPYLYFGPRTVYHETGWLEGEEYTLPGNLTSPGGLIPEGFHIIYVASRWRDSHLTKGYPGVTLAGAFRLGMCDWPGAGSLAEASLATNEHWCPADVMTPTPGATQVPPTPVPTETPCPTAVPTATTIPFTKPQLVSPADGSEFTSGDQIVLTWSCPGGRAWSKVVVEREGVTHDSGWTKEFSWESPFNNYGEVKWKAI